MINRLFVAAPVFYIGVCYLYLYLVHLGFGGHSVAFASAADIFSISFGRVAPFYFLMAGAYVYTHLYHIRDPLRIKGREEFEIHPTLRGPIASLPMRAFPWLMIAAFIVSYLVSNHFVTAFLILSGTPIYAKALRSIAEKNDIDLRATQIAGTFLLFTAILFSSAFSYGFFLRYASIESLSGDYAICGEAIVLMPVGDQFIVALPNGQRAVINHECEVKFKFEPRRATTWII